MKEGWIAGAGVDATRAEPLHRLIRTGLPEPDPHVPQCWILATTQIRLVGLLADNVGATRAACRC